MYAPFCSRCHMLKQQPIVHHHKFNSLMSHGLWELCMYTAIPQTTWHWHHGSFLGEQSMLRMHIFLWGALLNCLSNPMGWSPWLELLWLWGQQKQLSGLKCAVCRWRLPADDCFYWSNALNVLGIHNKDISQSQYLFFNHSTFMLRTYDLLQLSAAGTEWIMEAMETGRMGGFDPL